MDFFAQAFPLFSYFLTGLGLNLTPCVYPMLTVTVSIFGKTDGQQKIGVSFGKAFCYFLGIVVMYSSLGLFVSWTGNIFGAFLQNKLVLLAVAIFIFLLSLSMFGFYQIRVPSRVLSRLGQARTADYLGLFLSGLLVGVFAAPCIGPPIAALLSIAVANPASDVFWSFFALALGLGLPYLILGTFVGLIHKLPKSGQWLVWVERLFAVGLLGLALYYLSLALNPQWSKKILPLVLIGGGIYLGFFVRDDFKKAAFMRFKLGVGVVAFLIGFALLLTPSKTESLVWDSYAEQKVQLSLNEGKPLVIDFYADWCITCHELEQMVFSQKNVKEALNAFTRLRVDATYTDQPEVEKTLEKYGVFGLPTIVFLNAKGEEVKDARVIGYLSPEEFLEKVKLVEPSP